MKLNKMVAALLKTGILPCTLFTAQLTQADVLTDAFNSMNISAQASADLAYHKMQPETIGSAFEIVRNPVTAEVNILIPINGLMSDVWVSADGSVDFGFNEYKGTRWGAKLGNQYISTSSDGVVFHGGGYLPVNDPFASEPIDTGIPSKDYVSDYHNPAFNYLSGVSNYLSDTYEIACSRDDLYFPSRIEAIQASLQLEALITAKGLPSLVGVQSKSEIEERLIAYYDAGIYWYPINSPYQLQLFTVDQNFQNLGYVEATWGDDLQNLFTCATEREITRNLNNYKNPAELYFHPRYFPVGRAYDVAVSVGVSERYPNGETTYYFGVDRSLIAIEDAQGGFSYVGILNGKRMTVDALGNITTFEVGSDKSDTELYYLVTTPDGNTTRLNLSTGNQQLKSLITSNGGRYDFLLWTNGDEDPYGRMGNQFDTLVSDLNKINSLARDLRRYDIDNSSGNAMPSLNNENPELFERRPSKDELIAEIEALGGAVSWQGDELIVSSNIERGTTISPAARTMYRRITYTPADNAEEKGLILFDYNYPLTEFKAKGKILISSKLNDVNDNEAFIRFMATQWRWDVETARKQIQWIKSHKSKKSSLGNHAFDFAIGLIPIFGSAYQMHKTNKEFQKVSRQIQKIMDGDSYYSTLTQFERRVFQYDVYWQLWNDNPSVHLETYDVSSEASGVYSCEPTREFDFCQMTPGGSLGQSTISGISYFVGGNKIYASRFGLIQPEANILGPTAANYTLYNLTNENDPIRYGYVYEKTFYDQHEETQSIVTRQIYDVYGNLLTSYQPSTGQVSFTGYAYSDVPNKDNYLSVSYEKSYSGVFADKPSFTDGDYFNPQLNYNAYHKNENSEIVDTYVISRAPMFDHLDFFGYDAYQKLMSDLIQSNGKIKSANIVQSEKISIERLDTDPVLGKPYIEETREVFYPLDQNEYTQASTYATSTFDPRGIQLFEVSGNISNDGAHKTPVFETVYEYYNYPMPANQHFDYYKLIGIDASKIPAPDITELSAQWREVPEWHLDPNKEGVDYIIEDLDTGFESDEAQRAYYFDLRAQLFRAMDEYLLTFAPGFFRDIEEASDYSVFGVSSTDYVIVNDEYSPQGYLVQIEILDSLTSATKLRQLLGKSNLTYDGMGYTHTLSQKLRARLIRQYNYAIAMAIQKVVLDGFGLPAVPITINGQDPLLDQVLGYYNPRLSINGKDLPSAKMGLAYDILKARSDYIWDDGAFREDLSYFWSKERERHSTILPAFPDADLSYVAASNEKILQAKQVDAIPNYQSDAVSEVAQPLFAKDYTDEVFYQRTRALIMEPLSFAIGELGISVASSSDLQAKINDEVKASIINYMRYDLAYAYLSNQENVLPDDFDNTIYSDNAKIASDASYDTFIDQLDNIIVPKTNRLGFDIDARELTDEQKRILQFAFDVVKLHTDIQWVNSIYTFGNALDVLDGYLENNNQEVDNINGFPINVGLFKIEDMPEKLTPTMLNWNRWISPSLTSDVKEIINTIITNVNEHLGADELFSKLRIWGTKIDFADADKRDEVRALFSSIYDSPKINDELTQQQINANIVEVFTYPNPDANYKPSIVACGQNFFIGGAICRKYTYDNDQERITSASLMPGNGYDAIEFSKYVPYHEQTTLYTVDEFNQIFLSKPTNLDSLTQELPQNLYLTQQNLTFEFPETKSWSNPENIANYSREWLLAGDLVKNDLFINLTGQEIEELPNAAEPLTTTRHKYYRKDGKIYDLNMPVSVSTAFNPLLHAATEKVDVTQDRSLYTDEAQFSTNIPYDPEYPGVLGQMKPGFEQLWHPLLPKSVTMFGPLDKRVEIAGKGTLAKVIEYQYKPIVHRPELENIASPFYGVHQRKYLSLDSGFGNTHVPFGDDTLLRMFLMSKKTTAYNNLVLDNEGSGDFMPAGDHSVLVEYALYDLENNNIQAQYDTVLKGDNESPWDTREYKGMIYHTDGSKKRLMAVPFYKNAFSSYAASLFTMDAEGVHYGYQLPTSGVFMKQSNSPIVVTYVVDITSSRSHLDQKLAIIPLPWSGADSFDSYGFSGLLKCSVSALAYESLTNCNGQLTSADARYTIWLANGEDAGDLIVQEYSVNDPVLGLQLVNYQRLENGSYQVLNEYKYNSNGNWIERDGLNRSISWSGVNVTDVKGKVLYSAEMIYPDSGYYKKEINDYGTSESSPAGIYQKVTRDNSQPSVEGYVRGMYINPLTGLLSVATLQELGAIDTEVSQMRNLYDLDNVLIQQTTSTSNNASSEKVTLQTKMLNGLVMRVDDQYGDYISYVYDRWLRPSLIKRGDYETVEMSYNNDGSIQGIVTNGVEVRYEYNSDGAITSIESDMDKSMHYSYLDNLHKTTQGDYSYSVEATRGKSEYHAYLSSTNSELGNVFSGLFDVDYIQDDLGQVKEIKTSSGSFEISYDAQGRITAVTAPASGHLVYEYQADGLPDRGAIEADSSNHSESHLPLVYFKNFYEDDLLVYSDYRRRGEALLFDHGDYNDVSYTYDFKNRLITAVWDSEYIFDFNFNNFNQLATSEYYQKILPQQYTLDKVEGQYQYNGHTDQIIEAIFRKPHNLSLLYKDEIVRSLFTRPSEIVPLWKNNLMESYGSNNYSYDPLRRLSSYANANINAEYMYYANGNRATKVVENSNGRELQSDFVYNGQNQLVYEIRYENENLEAVIAYYWVGDVLIGAQMTEADGDFHQELYLYNGHRLAAVHRFDKRASGVTQNYTRLVADKTIKNPYGPLGDEITSSTFNPFLYGEGYFDYESGLIMLGNGVRYYSPELHGFIQKDPKFTMVDKYAYAGYDPINNTDASGFTHYRWSHESQWRRSRINVDFHSDEFTQQGLSNLQYKRDQLKDKFAVQVFNFVGGMSKGFGSFMPILSSQFGAVLSYQTNSRHGVDNQHSPASILTNHVVPLISAAVGSRFGINNSVNALFAESLNAAIDIGWTKYGNHFGIGYHNELGGNDWDKYWKKTLITAGVNVLMMNAKDHAGFPLGSMKPLYASNPLWAGTKKPLEDGLTALTKQFYE